MRTGKSNRRTFLMQIRRRRRVPPRRGQPGPRRPRRRRRHDPRRPRRLRRPRHRRRRAGPDRRRGLPTRRHGRALRRPPRVEPLDPEELARRRPRRRRRRREVRRLRRLQAGHRQRRRRPADHHARTSGRCSSPTPSRRASTPSSRSRWPSTRPGLRQYIQACRDSVDKGLSVVNGFCWRYHEPRRATMQQVFDGAIGDVVAIETTYNSQGVWDPRRTREECSSDMEYQLRNWYYYTWLSGDHIVEQAIHGLDTMNWAMQGAGPDALLGRRRPSGPHRPEVRQHLRPLLRRLRVPRGRPRLPPLPPLAEHRQPGEGLHPRRQGDLRRLRQPASAARPAGGIAATSNNMYQTEHDEMYAALRKGKPINNGEQAAYSTLLAIMGRMAAYTGQIDLLGRGPELRRAPRPRRPTTGATPPPTPSRSPA